MGPFDRLAPLDDDYASRPVAEAFDWTGVAAALPAGSEWYLVAFRSIRRVEADERRLTDYDDRAHAEAESSPGFVHYLKGPRAPDGSCLSFCLWQSRAEARAAARRPDHMDAVSILDEMYERYTLEFLRLSHGDGPGGLRFEPYDPVPRDGLGVRPAA